MLEWLPSDTVLSGVLDTGINKTKHVTCMYKMTMSIMSINSTRIQTFLFNEIHL